MNNYSAETHPPRHRRLVIIAVIAGVLALVPAAFTAWFAAFTVVGLSGSDTAFDPETFGIELVCLILTGVLLAFFPMIMSLGGHRRRWLLIALIPIIVVPVIGIALSVPYWV